MMTQKDKGNIFTISVSPGNKNMVAVGGENLQSLLMKNTIPLRSDCGGNGVCQKCSVNLMNKHGVKRTATACTFNIQEDLFVNIPATSLMVPQTIRKADICFPDSFLHQFQVNCQCHSEIGVGIDLGTTTIAIYLVDRKRGTVISSIAFKNPQAIYGDDVISRISYIAKNEKRLQQLQLMVTNNICWAVESLVKQYSNEAITPKEFVIVGNPGMIHILLGISPLSIGVSPYQPQFISSINTKAETLGMPYQSTMIVTLPLISGFVGGDILAAAIATELASQPNGTLLIDLGTNGELILKDGDKYWATSCATGPAFEGANISCGIQAIPGAIHKVTIQPDLNPSIFTLPNGKTGGLKPIGICGSGVISSIAECLRQRIIQRDGSFCRSLPEGIILDRDDGGRRYPLFTSSGQEVFISQRDIRNVQLGKAALITGIEFLLNAAGLRTPKKIIVAGAFGSHLEKKDLLTLGMIPEVHSDSIVMVGNAAGTGAIMCLCNKQYLEQAKNIGKKTATINLADDMAFQSRFIKRLSF